MSEDKKNYCPAWLFKLISCVIVYDYIVRDRAIFFSLKSLHPIFVKNTMMSIPMK